MYKPHIWTHGRVWYCGQQLCINGVCTPVPCAPIFGSGSDPVQAYADWRAAYDACAPSDQPFERGDIVRQDKDEFIVLCAHRNGALDVRCLENGEDYGLSADRCELVRKAGPGAICIIPALKKECAQPWWQFWQRWL